MATNPDLADGADQGRGGPVVADLVTRATNGDSRAWDALVERYAPLIWSICRPHGLGDADAVGQNVWLKLADQLENIRVPAALPGWLATTTRRECGRIRPAPAARDTGQAPDAETIPDDDARTAEEELLTAERHAALREAFTHLPPCCQQLIALLIENPPLLCRDQRQAEHPGRQHRPEPRPLPGPAVPPPGYRRADQPRRRDRGVRCTSAQPPAAR